MDSIDKVNKIKKPYCNFCKFDLTPHYYQLVNTNVKYCEDCLFELENSSENTAKHICDCCGKEIAKGYSIFFDFYYCQDCLTYKEQEEKEYE